MKVTLESLIEELRWIGRENYTIEYDDINGIYTISFSRYETRLVSSDIANPSGK